MMLQQCVYKATVV